MLCHWKIVRLAKRNLWSNNSNFYEYYIIGSFAILGLSFRDIRTVKATRKKKLVFPLGMAAVKARCGGDDGQEDEFWNANSWTISFAKKNLTEKAKHK